MTTFNITLDLELASILAVIILALTVIILTVFDVTYFLTTFGIMLWCQLRPKNKIKVDGIGVFHGICTMNDMDVYFNHMNNARYIRELDFARLHFYIRCGIFSYVYDANGSLLLTEQHIRYNKPIPFMAPYKILTKVVYWDEKHIYTEHQYVGAAGNVTTVVVCKQIVSGVDLPKMMNELAENEDLAYRPAVPEDLEEWMQLSKKYSNRLKNALKME